MEGELYFITDVNTVGEQPEAGGEMDGAINMQSVDTQAGVTLKKLNIESLKNTIKGLSEVMNSEEIEEGKFQVEQIDVSLGINGSGEVGIIGIFGSAKAGAEASIKVTLKRNKR